MSMLGPWDVHVRQVFMLGPLVLLPLCVLLNRYLCRVHLQAMLDALKSSPRFAAAHERGLEHLGFVPSVVLLLSIGHALMRRGKGLANGTLMVSELDRFPGRLRVLALANLLGMVLITGWSVLWLGVLTLHEPSATSKYAGTGLWEVAWPFLLAGVSYAINLYLGCRRLSSLIDAIGLSPAYRSLHRVELERLVFIARSMLIVRLGMAVLVGGRRAGRLQLDCFDLDAVPRWVKLLAAIEWVCAVVALIGLFIIAIARL